VAIVSAAQSHNAAAAKAAASKLVKDIVSAKATATTLSDGNSYAVRYRVRVEGCVEGGSAPRRAVRIAGAAALTRTLGRALLT